MRGRLQQLQDSHGTDAQISRERQEIFLSEELCHLLSRSMTSA